MPDLEAALRELDAESPSGENCTRRLKRAFRAFAGEPRKPKAEGKIEAGATLAVHGPGNILVLAVVGRTFWGRIANGIAHHIVHDSAVTGVVTPATVEVGDTVQHEEYGVGLVYHIYSDGSAAVTIADEEGCYYTNTWSRDEFTILRKGPPKETP